MKKNDFYLWLNGELSLEEKEKISYSFLFPSSFVRYFIIPSINGEISDYPVISTYERLEEYFNMYNECIVYAIDCKDLSVIEIDMYN